MGIGTIVSRSEEQRRTWTKKDGTGWNQGKPTQEPCSSRSTRPSVAQEIEVGSRDNSHSTRSGNRLSMKSPTPLGSFLPPPCHSPSRCYQPPGRPAHPPAPAAPSPASFSAIQLLVPHSSLFKLCKGGKGRRQGNQSNPKSKIRKWSFLDLRICLPVNHSTCLHYTPETSC